ncbi:Myosin-binding protein [Quillaja saponaria]|uniref:Myosin-binding protein n=1 Tax=Quillaja saponaria TaxID=32244 RepID=A0AAD7LCM5_QUISA|nr:Myosin-binding protein [Quillaja saponaria]
MLSIGIPETNITAMKETLRAQQQLLQKLYAELDQEREASATAASEALSMILRLQGEKATMKMEASQYKRMVEEKMCHAESSLAVIEDIIYQKEMEIASLEFQVQAYRCKLLSMGCSDIGAFECQFPDNMLLQKCDLNNGEKIVSSSVRRLNSLPPIALEDYKKSILERETSLGPMSDVISKIVEKSTNNEVVSQSIDSMKKLGNSAGENLNSYWEQIRRLNAQVKDLSDPKEAEGELYSNMVGGLRSYSSLSQVDLNKTYARTSGIPCSDVVQVDYHETTGDGEEMVTSFCSLNVHDTLCPTGAFEPNVKDETEGLKNKLHTKNHGLKFSDPKMSSLGHKRDATSIDCNAGSICPTTGVAASQAQLQNLCQRIERLEGETNSIRQEISSSGDEELKLLKEIHEQLNTIQSEMSCWKVKKSPPQDDSSLLPVQEAMLYFWF